MTNPDRDADPKLTLLFFQVNIAPVDIVPDFQSTL